MRILCSEDKKSTYLNNPEIIHSASAMDIAESLDLVILRLSHAKGYMMRPFDPSNWLGAYFSQTSESSLSFLSNNFDWFYNQFPSEENGYLLLVRKSFLIDKKFPRVYSPDLFARKGFSQFILNRLQFKELCWIFDKIWKETGGYYKYQKELIGDLLILMIHFTSRNFGR